MILDLIEKNKNITQREIGESIEVAVSMINNYLDEYEEKGLIKRKYHSTKTVEYFVTKKGVERRKLLNIQYLKDSQIVYQSAKNNIISFLNQIVDKGFKKILLYGAGEVAEIILDVIKGETKIPLQALAVIDDDENKTNHKIVNTKIINISQINEFEHDGILISSYTHNKTIYNKLINFGYDNLKILQFFE